MKFFALILSACFLSLNAEAPQGMQSIQVLDTNSEVLPGAKIELMGTGKSYYTNLKGYCLIPVDVLKSAQSIKVECISYKTQLFKNYELNSKIVLDFR